MRTLSGREIGGIMSKQSASLVSRCLSSVAKFWIDMADNLKPFDPEARTGVLIEKSPLELRIEVLEMQMRMLLRESHIVVSRPTGPEINPDRKMPEPVITPVVAETYVRKPQYGYEDQYGKEVSPEEHEIQARAEKMRRGIW
jgi:hypothetical protein